VLPGARADEGLLASYDGERRAAALENLDVTTHTMDFLRPRTEQARPTARTSSSGNCALPGPGVGVLRAGLPGRVADATPRLRELARRGVLLLTADEADVELSRRRCRAAGPGQRALDDVPDG
jgi:hypothetical protein